MARIRSIKPEFPHSESMGRVSRDARLCFILLWTLADDSGRLRGSSRMLASLLFPYDDDAPGLMDGWLGALEREGCIERYKVEGSAFIQIAKWLSHQKIDKPSASKIPAKTDPSRILANPRERSSEDQGLDQGSRKGGEGDDSRSLDGESEPATTPAGLLCKAIKAAGIPGVNPGHADLLRLMAGGIPTESFTATAVELVGKGKGSFPLLLATVEGRWNDAQKAPALAAAAALAPGASAVAQTANLLAEQAAAAERARSPEAQAARLAAMAKVKGVANV